MRKFPNEKVSKYKPFVVSLIHLSSGLFSLSKITGIVAMLINYHLLPFYKNKCCIQKQVKNSIGLVIIMIIIIIIKNYS